MDLAIQARSGILYFFFGPFLLLSSIFVVTNASVHVYDKEPFREVGNAFLLSGGSEGILASLTAAIGSGMTSSIHDGRSYIR